jgi:hypothetical protein
VPEQLSPARPGERPEPVSDITLCALPPWQLRPPPHRAARRAWLVAALTRRRRLARVTFLPATGRRLARIPPPVAALLAQARAEQAGALDGSDLPPEWERLLGVVHGRFAEDAIGPDRGPCARAAATPPAAGTRTS